MTDELYYRLALLLHPKITNFNAKRLIRLFGSASLVFDPQKKKEHRKELIKWNLNAISIDKELDYQIQTERDLMEKEQIQALFFDQSDYPTRLLTSANYPAIFFYKGENVFNKPHVLSIIGTRNITNYGIDVVKKMIPEMAHEGLVIVSGLASGVDTLAHEEAIRNGVKTVGVMGHGFSLIYPSQNYKLAKNMIDSGGAIATEYAYHTTPIPQNFPTRNRIIAGLSDASLVIESKIKGGSMITASMVLNIKRDLFTVPGSIYSPNHEGCNNLIVEGLAQGVTSGGELLAKMGWTDQPLKEVQTKLFLELSEEEEEVYQLLLEVDQMGIDEINSKLTQYTPSRLASILLHMEFDGIVECKPGKIYRLIRR